MPKMGAVRRPQTPAFRQWVLLLEHSAGSPLTRRQGSLPLTTRKLHTRGFFLHALSSDSAGCFPNAEAYTRHGTREKMFGGVGHSRAWAKKEGAAYVSEAWNAQGCHPSLATWPIPAQTCFSTVSQGTLSLHYHELQYPGDKVTMAILQVHRWRKVSRCRKIAPAPEFPFKVSLTSFPKVTCPLLPPTPFFKSGLSIYRL